MAIVGTFTDKTNPEFTIAAFTVWFPQFKKFLATQDGQATWDVVYPIANEMIFKSIYGPIWSRAIALMIAHLMTLIAGQQQVPEGDTLDSIAGLTNTKGVMSSAHVGAFSVQYELSKTMSEEEEAKWYNYTPFGAELYAIMKTRHVATIFVVTSNPIPGPGPGPRGN